MPHDPSPTLRRTALILPLLAALTAGVPALDAWAAGVDTGAVAQAVDRLQQAATGQSEAIEDVLQRFQRLHATDPSDPVLRAYLGAATSMRATTTWMPWKKMQHAEDGLALIDKALAQLGPAHDAPLHRGVPAVLEARFVAAGTFLSLPSLFNRAERGRQQLDAVLKSPLLATAPAPFQAAVWLRAAQQAEQDGQSAMRRQWLQKVAASGAPQAGQARRQLEAM